VADDLSHRSQRHAGHVQDHDRGSEAPIRLAFPTRYDRWRRASGPKCTNEVGVGGSYATTSRTVLQRPPQASDSVVVRFATEMHAAHPDWQAQRRLSVEEFQGFMLMVCRVPDFPRVNVSAPVDEQDSAFTQIVKLHYEYLRNHDKARICEFAAVFPVETRPVERAASPESERTTKRPRLETVLADDIEDADCQEGSRLEHIISAIDSDAEVRNYLNDAVVADDIDTQDADSMDEIISALDSVINDVSMQEIMSALDSVINDVINKHEVEKLVNDVINDLEVAKMEQWYEEQSSVSLSPACQIKS
jgi:hypothetical protein